VQLSLRAGVVVDFDALFEELADLEKKGVSYKGRMLISDRAHILFPFHKARCVCGVSVHHTITVYRPLPLSLSPPPCLP
jgi:hypothetical protein